MVRITIAFLVLIVTFPSVTLAQTYVQSNISQPAQLQGNAGADGLICPGDSTLIGSNMVALGGTPPYLYAWSPGAGLSSSTVPEPMAGPAVTTAYALLVTDSANCTAFDTVTVVIDTCVGLLPGMGIAAFDVFPNPNRGEFKIQVSGNFLHSSLHLRIMTLHGQVIESRVLGTLSGSLESQFDFRHLSKGTYLLEIVAGEHHISRKVVLN